MSEYWISTAKYHCKVCNVWMADNKTAILNHNQGSSHKFKLSLADKKKRDSKLYGARDEKELQRQLRELDAAALAAVAIDRSDHNGLFYSANSPSIRPPPPSHSYNFNNFNNNISELSEKSNDAIADNLRDDKSGFYKIGDQGYLEGALNEDKLIKGLKCEIFIEELEEWLSAEILLVKVLSIPNTTLFLTSYNVSYKVKSQDNDNDNEQLILLDNIKSEKLRILVGIDNIDNELENCNKLEKTENIKLLPPVEESTGLGGWQTVSVKEYDEEKERKKVIKQEKYIKKQLIKEEEEKILGMSLVSDEHDDVMSLVDPKGSNSYKGVVLVEDIIDNELECIAKGEKVAFKKRKKNNGSTRISSSYDIK